MLDWGVFVWAWAGFNAVPEVPARAAALKVEVFKK
jgi:hypothetical protein